MDIERRLPEGSRQVGEVESIEVRGKFTRVRFVVGSRKSSDNPGKEVFYVSAQSLTPSVPPLGHQDTQKIQFEVIDNDNPEAIAAAIAKLRADIAVNGVT